MYLHDDADVLSQAVRAASVEYGLHEDYVLKDYFAVMLLKEVTRRDEDLVFKGGTCLSKCYGVIERFSEDVDLGIPFEHATEGMRKRIKAAVIESVEALGLTVSNLDSTRSRRDYNRYEIVLPGSKGVVLLETAVMTPAAPYAVRVLQSFVGQFLEARGQGDLACSFELDPFEVKANSLERTFADKVFAICDYYLYGDIPPRQSRHLYDLHKLIDNVELGPDMQKLMETVRFQRAGSFRCPSADPSVDLQETIRSILAVDAYRTDYEKVTVPLLYEDVGYDEVMSSLADIADFLGRR